ncbi:MAG: T9SS type A sorting domain-containing protein [Candidatus Kapabacteria bacterium]|nr:T9SS type A sorting domain-containing protein [Ignavibacteriota bacterium]MCW5885566.1 T9SS type A sorting domain-containing protein [Candidatus Kapabacteria bacterium]
MRIFFNKYYKYLTVVSSWIFLLFLPVNLEADTTKTKCFGIDRGIEDWRKKDTIETSVLMPIDGEDFIKAYPNPSVSLVFFEIKRDLADYTATIEDIRGFTINRFDNEKLIDEILSWDLRNDAGEKVAPGAYFLKIKSQKGILIKKFIIE